MLLNLLLSLNLLVCVALIGVVLLQRSEGGALGSGGGPTGLITTRGAGDLLTRTTWILFTLFLLLSLALTLIGGRMHSSQAFINQLKGTSINPDVLGTAPAPTPAAAAAGQVAPTPAPASAAQPVQTAPAAAPAQTAPALTAPAPVVRTVARKPMAATPAAPAAAAPAAPVIDVPAPAPKVVTAPAPLEVPKPAASKPADPDAPVKTNTPP
jgi:preprotein translocase subunit SecG